MWGAPTLAAALYLLEPERYVFYKQLPQAPLEVSSSSSRTPFPHRLRNKILAFYLRTDCVAQLRWGEARRKTFGIQQKQIPTIAYTIHHTPYIKHIPYP